jgi:integrase
VARSKGFVFLTEDELLLVLRTAKTKSIRDWSMILTTYSHGLRAAETCRLKVTDLDMRGGVLSIQRLKGSLFTIQELERHRGIPLLDEVKALKEWLAVRPTCIKAHPRHTHGASGRESGESAAGTWAPFH